VLLFVAGRGDRNCDGRDTTSTEALCDVKSSAGLLCELLPHSYMRAFVRVHFLELEFPTVSYLYFKYTLLLLMKFACIITANVLLRDIFRF
jgi:hypothetical protein